MAGEINVGPNNNHFAIVRLIIGLVELWVVAIVLILGCAFLMGVLGANPDASFASWIYDRTREIMTPFNGMFDTVKINGSSVIQTSLLFAMAVYAVIGSVIGAIGRRIATF